MIKKLVSLIKWVPTVLTMGTIFFLSHQPGQSLHLYALPGIDKLAHLSIYGLLAGSIIFGMSLPFKTANPKKVFLITVCLCLLYGITDEMHQAFIPDRTVSLLDILADFLGAVLVCLGWVSWKRWKVGRK